MGSDAKGIIMYTPDGYMSAQITPSFTQKESSTTNKTENDVAATDFLQTWGSYIAYSGPFYLDEKGDDKGRPILMHKMQISNVPFLVGDIQRRLCRMDDENNAGFLVLSLDEPMTFSGEKRLIRVCWRREPDNNMASSPA